ncbi:hypothetical protein HYFRA_00003232 [Hymenoscyphus fraxineus]|uniref:SCP domain-containing protein n=1 Tax=Hymenoscyphus fraxineus TaxID=746836 RepID=A0A9N9KSE9_9HELO|nr:hypothetical protein HYFRA_00003232 [Hymenoscyphus fraxineus]
MAPQTLKQPKALLPFLLLPMPILSTPTPAANPQIIYWTTAATVTVTAAPPPPQPPDPSFAFDETFKSQILADQNWYRAQHDAVSLVWNEELEESSRDWVGRCYFGHSVSGSPSHFGFEHKEGVGENIAAAYKNVVESVDAWGLERTNYNYSKPGFSEATGHFTQLVWKESREVGCARVECPPTNRPPNPLVPAWYVVCQYYPPGNIPGEYQKNVTPQSKGVLALGIGGTADGRFTISIPDAENNAEAVLNRGWMVFGTAVIGILAAMK